MRVYAKEGDWDEAARDEDYGDQIYGADVAPDGRLITTCYDGKVRPYAPDLAGPVRPAVMVEAPEGQQPFRIAFNAANGAQVALGYADVRKVSALDGHTLAALPSPHINSDGFGVFAAVAWSRDGAILFAGVNGSEIVAWSVPAQELHECSTTPGTMSITSSGCLEATC